MPADRREPVLDRSIGDALRDAADVFYMFWCNATCCYRVACPMIGPSEWIDAKDRRETRCAASSAYQ
jgi:hypothetical protein